ncbi:hypothetical protein [Methanolobus sp. WCC5]|uniref:hypothetical protein n=1 Tax=Methanolobus sp. WCC5 TaxID=3125785 RepID=UPI0032506F2E
MTGLKTTDIPRKELSELIKKGNELLELLEEKSVTNDQEYQKKRNMFIADYNKWYSRCLPVVRSMVPDKAVRFESLYHTNKRSGTNEYTYTIQDYIHGIYFKDKPKSYTDNITSKRVKEQNSILQAALPRTDDFSFDMERFVKINPIPGQPSYSISKQNKLIEIDFEDEHYNSIRTEINSCFKRGSFMAVLLLSKELIRNLLLDIIRIRFTPMSEENISLYYDPHNNNYMDIRPLLGMLTEKKEEMGIDTKAIDQLVKMAASIDPKPDPKAHTFRNIPTHEDIDNYKINDTLILLNDILELMKS